jgi:Zn ribbon nucleic-acid-binding protein
MDKLVVDSEAQLRECVVCGFKDQRPLQADSEVNTRVNRPAARLVETKAEPLRFTESDQEED